MIHGILAVKFRFITGKEDRIMDYINTTMQIFGYITATGAAFGVVLKLFRAFKKPSDENSKKIVEHEEKIKELNVKADKDYQAINEIKTMQSAMCQALIALIDHEITGNHVDGLKNTKKDLIKQLTEH